MVISIWDTKGDLNGVAGPEVTSSRSDQNSQTNITACFGKPFLGFVARDVLFCKGFRQLVDKKVDKSKRQLPIKLLRKLAMSTTPRVTWPTAVGMFRSVPKTYEKSLKP